MQQFNLCIGIVLHHLGNALCDAIAKLRGSCARSRFIGAEDRIDAAVFILGHIALGNVPGGKPNAVRAFVFNEHDTSAKRHQV